MDTRSVAGKKSEGIDAIEGCMASFRSELNQIGSQLERLNHLDVERLNSSMDRLPKVEESLISLIRHLEARTSKSELLVPTPMKSTTDDALQEFKVSGSCKGKSGEEEDAPMGRTSQADRDILPRRLELPIFDGGNPDGWLFRVERYFEINKLTPAEKLRAAFVCLEGDALAWYFYEDGRRGFRGWSEDFRELLLERFRTSQEGTLLDQLFTLRQAFSVWDFQRHFEILSASLRDVADAVLESAFVNGLREDIRAKLRLWALVGLPQMMRIAQQIEDKNMAVQARRSGPPHPMSKPVPTGFYIPTRTIHTQPISRPVNLGLSSQKFASSMSSDSRPTNNPQNFRRLTEAEMQEKRSKGLCFRCDEKYGPDHRCKQKELQVLWVLDEEELEDRENEIYTKAEEITLPGNTIDPNKDSSPLSLSLSSMVGLSAPHSLKIQGRIKDRDVVVLNDSGASHNFISAMLVGELGLSVASTKEFGVILGTGAEIRVTGVCQQIKLHLTELEIIAVFFRFPWEAQR